MRYFKYISEDYMLDVVRDNRFYMASADTFNDPFEFDIVPGEIDKKKCLALYPFYTMSLNFILQKQILVDDESYLKAKEFLEMCADDSDKFDYIKSEDIQNELINKYGKINHNSQFIKKFESVFNEISKIFKKIRREHLLCCFAKSNRQIRMWSYYASNHRGICVEFEIDEANKIISEVCYSKERHKVDYIRIFTTYFLWKFGVKSKKALFDVIESEVYTMSFLKSKQRKYENEVRYSPHSSKNEMPLVTEGEKTFLKVTITKVYLGCKTNINSDSVKEIIKICEERDIPIFVAEKSEKEYKLEFYKL